MVLVVLIGLLICLGLASLRLGRRGEPAMHFILRHSFLRVVGRPDRTLCRRSITHVCK